MLLASFNSGNPVIGLLILPFFLGGPFLLLWFEVRSFLKSEAQSFLILLLMLALGILAWSYGIGSVKEFSRTMGFWKTHLIVTWIGAIGCPVAVGWEVYKRGWLRALTAAPKKKKRRIDA